LKSVTNPLLLVVSDLSCQRGERPLFSGLSFSLGAGEVLVVTGPNGVGKTSLLRMIAGLTQKSTGKIELEGQIEFEGQGDDAPLSEHMHYLGHRDGLRAALTALENLNFATHTFGAPNLTPQDALSRVGLLRVADLPVGVLSAGQRRRVALARLLVSKRPIWLLDEPTSGLDTASQEKVADIIRDHTATGGMVIAATHLALTVASVRTLRFAADGSHGLVQGDA
jgi:heme exporter protein A